MSFLARTDRSVFGTWWWTVDRVMLTGFALLAAIGVILVFTASPPVARTLHISPDHFILKHISYLLPAALLLVGTSLLSPLGVLRLATVMLVVFGALLLLTLVAAADIKGATRWLAFGPVLVQPSEFVKPALAVVTARLITRRPGLGGLPWTIPLVGLCLLVLFSQPDLGMVAVVGLVYAIQLFLAGIPWALVLGLNGLAVAGGWLAYTLFPHVSRRIDTFLDPNTVGYQVEMALRAVASGGLFGRGPGEGVEKFLLPDAHTDFVFAAAAEEFGIVACLIIAALFAGVLLRGFWRIYETTDRFIQLAAAGLVSQFALQALINMAVNLNLMPTKGMTLPFISYGGSSTVALALGMGMLLALTRRGARLELVE
jgi:cell division protein FtsW